MVCLLVVFFLNDNEAILLLVKFQINSPVLFQNDATCLGICIQEIWGGSELRKNKQIYTLPTFYYEYLKWDQFIKEIYLINKII